ncbi:MAG: 4-(cytidine 5'-diphospho)-2-C-methyl-D-erythritol kinase [Firmicutes bacterium]|jgi:4-diphosphocytidyl-2-C-methyl-D-erythritol kinase|nr:4-(cytidine 5'-diphospho)-2-C-methyl-D-erythritol kinase [Bacillota bacterium]MCL5992630.1 4-(cytidine 5'-diphospho)-2-C-methyl-D-erythritol kinase [Bacillota bacterium]
MIVIEKAYAKINLILDVAGKRPDGYHEIRTVMQSLSLYDTITLSEKSHGQISLDCNLAELPVDAGNLAWQAASLIQAEYGVASGVHITLKKRIPVAAGLGGGSSNAAAVLRGLVRLWGLSPKEGELSALAAKLGSDVPFCLSGGTALGTGRGEIVTALPTCPHFYVVLANPGFPVSTASVYQNFRFEGNKARPDIDGMIAAICRAEQSGILVRLANALESSTFSLYPLVQELKVKMGQMGAALMCGSGATVFALFTAAAAARRLQQALLAAGTTAWLTETI